MKKIDSLCDGYQRLSDKEGLGLYLKKYYKEKDPIRVVATPWKMVHKEQSKIAVLCCHGYTGNPGEMCYPGLELFNNGFDVFAPRYPGHGGSRSDFLNTTSNDWLSVARKSAEYLKQKYEKLYILGHSMGGIVSIIIAKEFDVDKLVTLAPATDIIGFNTFYLRLSNIFIKKIKKSWKSDSSYFGICERDSGDDQYLGKELWSYHFPKQILELNKIKKLALKDITELRADTFCIIGSEDKTIKQDSVNRIKNKPLGKNDGLIIKKAGHLVQYSKYKEAREECNKKIVEWFLK